MAWNSAESPEMISNYIKSCKSEKKKKKKTQKDQMVVVIPTDELRKVKTDRVADITFKDIKTVEEFKDIKTVE